MKTKRRVGSISGNITETASINVDMEIYYEAEEKPTKNGIVKIWFVKPDFTKYYRDLILV